jgi:ATP-binding cassette subfamily C protein
MALARALGRAKDKKITIVAITQRPSLLQSVDRIMIIKDGTTQTIGKRDEIIPLLNGRPPNANGAPPPVNATISKPQLEA